MVQRALTSPTIGSTTYIKIGLIRPKVSQASPNTGTTSSNISPRSFKIKSTSPKICPMSSKICSKSQGQKPKKVPGICIYLATQPSGCPPQHPSLLVTLIAPNPSSHAPHPSHCSNHFPPIPCRLSFTLLLPPCTSCTQYCIGQVS